MNTGRASNTGRGSDIIVLIEAGGFYSRKYGNCNTGKMCLGEGMHCPSASCFKSNAYEYIVERSVTTNKSSA